MRWTLGSLALSMLMISLVLIMCAGYVGLDALLGAAVLTGVLGFTALIIKVMRR